MKAVYGPLIALVALSAPAPALSQCLLAGTYDSTPPVDYTCCMSIIDYDVSQWVITFNGTQMTVRPQPRGTLPATLIGTINCQNGTFSVSAFISGGCSETYTLQGQVQSASSWSGTLTAQYTGPDCDCFGGMFGTPCQSQQFMISGSLPPTAVDSAPSLARIAIGPNPFSGSTTIRVRLERGGEASLDVVDVAGRVVASLVESAPLADGDYQFMWDARGDDGNRVASGVYFIRLRSESVVRMAKVLVID